MGPLVMFLIGAVLAATGGFIYNAASTSVISSQTEAVSPNTTPAPATTPRSVTSIRISPSDTFDRRAAEIRPIIQYFTEHRDARADAIWRINTRTATDNYNGTTQEAIHHFIPGEALRDAFCRELTRPANEWSYIVQMLRVAIESLRTIPSTDSIISQNLAFTTADWTLDLIDERVRSTLSGTYDYDFISNGLDSLYRVFYWSSFNLFIGPLPQRRQPADPGNKMDVQFLPLMTAERSNRLRNLYEYVTGVAGKRNFDNNAVTDYISLTSIYPIPTSSGPWRPLSRTFDEYFHELVRISRGQDQPTLTDAESYLSQNMGLMASVREQFEAEVIDALKACEKCRSAISSTDKHDCQRKKCPFFIKRVNTYYILDQCSVMRTWIEFLLGKKEGVTPKFSLPDDVKKNYFDCDNDKDDGSGSCPNFCPQNQHDDDESQGIEQFDKAFKKPNPDTEFKNMKHLPNRYLEPFGNPLVMSSLTPIVVNCLVLLHNNPIKYSIGNTRPVIRRRRDRVNENDIDVKYNAQYLLKLVELIHQDTNVDELSIFKQIVTGATSPNIQSSFNRVCT